jgi:hypothetical protein
VLPLRRSAVDSFPMARFAALLLLPPVLLCLDAAGAPPSPVAAVLPASVLQDVAPAAPRLVVEPARLELEVGETAQLSTRLVGADGRDVPAAERGELLFFSRARRSVSVTPQGLVEALRPGTFELVVRERGRSDGGENQASRQALGRGPSTSVEVVVRPPAVRTLQLDSADIAPTGVCHAGTTFRLVLRGVDARGDEVTPANPKFVSSDPSVAVVDALGDVTVLRPGPFRVSATVDGIVASRELAAHPNPITTITLTPKGAPANPLRTGDVLRVDVSAAGGDGAEILGVPVDLSFRAEPLDPRGAGASGQLEPIPGAEREWRFVAEDPGRYRITARSGAAIGVLTFDVVARKVQGRFELVGHGPVRDMHTSDLWVWEGVDGRDYAVTGTWGANGDAIFWDVTDPKNIERIATVTVDARTVNDVKVSADGRICVLSREGASNRKNGVVLVDVVDPRNPRVISGFDDELTGGVHNVFIDGNHVYALSAGQRYDILDVSDPGSPRRVGTYKVDRPNPSIHDVWVVDGLAYSSNWSDGVHIVDVGNGLAGGSPTDPQFVTSYAYPSGWNHAAFPYRPKDSGLFYVVAGDEAFPYGLNLTGKPTYPRGWLHFIDFTDLERPREVARYEVPEAGTHNLWIEDDVLYCAYYNAGLRAVDVSGEVLGDLYRQGREIAWFLPDDPEGHVSNAPMAWGPQPHKGHVFFSDWNSGLWAVKLVR